MFKKKGTISTQRVIEIFKFKKNKITMFLMFLQKTFSWFRNNFLRVITLFLIGFVSRFFINTWLDINVFRDFLNTISLYYYLWLSSIVVYINSFEFKINFLNSLFNKISFFYKNNIIYKNLLDAIKLLLDANINIKEWKKMTMNWEGFSYFDASKKEVSRLETKKGSILYMENSVGSQQPLLHPPRPILPPPGVQAAQAPQVQQAPVIPPVNLPPFAQQAQETPLLGPMQATDSIYISPGINYRNFPRLPFPRESQDLLNPNLPRKRELRIYFDDLKVKAKENDMKFNTMGQVIDKIEEIYGKPAACGITTELWAVIHSNQNLKEKFIKGSTVRAGVRWSAISPFNQELMRALEN